LRAVCRASVCLVRFARGADKPVGLDQRMAAFSLRPQPKTDDDEGLRTVESKTPRARLLLFSQNEQGARFPAPLPC
jgi:hypothetical protein